MSKLEEKIREISTYYEQMKQSQDWTKKKQLALQLIKLCAEAQRQMQIQIPSAKIFRNKTHINNIQNASIQVNKQADDIINKKKRKFDLSSQSKEIQKLSQISQQQKSKRIVRLIVQKQLKSQQLKVPIEQYQKIRDKMQNNLDLTQKVKFLLQEQKQNLDNLQDNIDRMYDNIQVTNIDLNNAAEQQFRTRLMSIKLGVTGLLAAIGYGILGIPGMIVGGVVGLFKTLT